MGEQNQQSTGETKNSQKPFYKKWWGVILSIMFLPIFVAWFVWTKTKWSKTAKWVVTAVIVVITIGTIGSNGENNNQTASQPQQSAPAPATQTADNSSNNATNSNHPASQPTPPSDEDQIKQMVSDKLQGKNATTGEDLLRKIDVTKQADGSWNVIVEYSAEDNLTTNMIKQGIDMKMSEIYKALYTSGKNISTASISAYYPMADKYGNKTDAVVYTTKLDKSEAGKVNWNTDEASLELNILPNVWTTTFIQPDFQG